MIPLLLTSVALIVTAACDITIQPGERAVKHSATQMEKPRFRKASGFCFAPGGLGWAGK
jgi:hypothetical protein